MVRETLLPWRALRMYVAMEMARMVGLEGSGSQAAKYSIKPIGEPPMSFGIAESESVYVYVYGDSSCAMFFLKVDGKTVDKVPMEERLSIRRASTADSWMVGM